MQSSENEELKVEESLLRTRGEQDLRTDYKMDVRDLNAYFGTKQVLPPSTCPC